MKKNFQRVVAFIMAVMMVLTMSNWSGIATVAKAASSLTVYYYNYNNGVKPLSGTITATVVSGGISQDVTMTADTGLPYGASSTSNWYVATLDVEDTAAFTVTVKGSGSGDATVGSGMVGTGIGRVFLSPIGATYYGTEAEGYANGGAEVEAAFGVEAAPAVTYTNVYFYDGAEWGSGNVYATSWDSADFGGTFTWPGPVLGVAAELGEGWYYYSVPSTHNTAVIHNNATGGTQYKTGDIAMTVGQAKYVVYTANSENVTTDAATQVGTFKEYTNQAEALAAVEAFKGGSSETQYTRIYFYKGTDWGNVYGYSYNPETFGAWPGTLAVTASDMGANWYYVDIPYSDAGWCNLIFNNGGSNGYANGERKTTDLTVNNGITQYIVYTADSTDSSNAAGAHTSYTNVDEAKAAVDALTGAVPGTIYAYIPSDITSGWLEGRVPAVIIDINGNEQNPWTQLVAMGSAYPGWYSCTVENINTITQLQLSNPYYTGTEGALNWAQGNTGVASPELVSDVAVTADSWTDGAIALYWNTTIEAKSYEVTDLATNVIGLTEGYPGHPIDLSVYNVHVYNAAGWENWVGYYWGSGTDASAMTGTLEGDWIVFRDIPAEMWGISFGEKDPATAYYPQEIHGVQSNYYFYTGQPSADKGGYLTAAEAIAAANASHMVNVYFYQENDWANAGIAYQYNGVEYFTAPGTAIEGCPKWYLTQVPLGATSVKIVQVAWDAANNKYVWGGNAATLVNGVPNGNGADIAICQQKDVAYTVEGLAAELGLTAGYPGQPLPGTMDVWYYNPAWSGHVVYLNYRSTLTGWTEAESPGKKMTEAPGMPGWFFVDGDTGIYQPRLPEGDIKGNEVQIFMTKDGMDGNTASKYSNHYFYNKGIIADGTREDFNMNADVLYLYDGVNDGEMGHAYDTSAELAAATGQTQTPDDDTVIYIYRDNLELTGGYVENMTAQYDNTNAPWYTLTVKGMNAAAYPMKFGFGRWTADFTWESGSIPISTSEVYINGDTNIMYTSREALEAGLTSTFYIYAPDGMPTDVTATHKIVDNNQSYMVKKDQEDAMTLEAVTVDGESGWYKATVATDADEVGYALTYTYNGKTYITNVHKEDARIDAATGKVEGALRAYYYAGLENDGIAAANKTLWTTVYADVFYYKKGTTEKVLVYSDVECISDGDGWFYLDTGLDALDAEYENGVYVQFKNAPGVVSGIGFEHTVTDAGTITAAYQFLNNYRTYTTSQMTMHKSKSDAIKALANTESVNDVPTDMVRVWYYFPGGWTNYYVFYATAAGGNNPAEQAYAGNYSQLVKQEAYTDNLGGGWYYADIPTTANYIYFDEDNTFGNGGNISQMYDISDRHSNEIFCVVNDSIIPGGWSTSTAAIAQFYGLVNVPASNEISMPVTILDYNADNLFFEYDMYFLRNMTLVLGNQGGWYGMNDMGISAEDDWSVSWPTIDIEGLRPGDAPHYDRNGKEYVSGVLENTLINGYPVYTEQAVTYIAKVVERGMFYYAKGLEKAATEGVKVTQSYNKTVLFEQLYKNLTGDNNMNGQGLAMVATSDWHAAYEASKAKYTAADFKLSEYDITADTSLTCMDYAYYVLNNLYDTNSNYNKDYGMYSYLVLKRTSPNVYGFYANFETNLPTAYNLPQNYEIIYAPSAEEGKGSIFNNVNDATTLYATEEGMQPTGTDAEGNTTYTRVEGYAGMFPYNLPLIEAVYGTGTNETTDAPVSEADGYVNVDGNTQAETNFYRYRDYVINGKTVTVEYIDSNAYSLAAGIPSETTTYTTEYRNYNYALKLSGKFRFDYEEDLYFTFTGDDDVVLYINGIKVLDLSGAHQAASYTVYLSDLVDDGIVPMTNDAYYDLDFFYMERHTTWSNMRIETNIDVIDVSGTVQKHAYDKDGNIIPSGSVVDTNAEVTFEYELISSASDGLTEVTFEDPNLGISLTPDEIILGSYVDAEGNTVERKVEDLVITVGSTTYTNLTEDELKDLLEDGVDAGQVFKVSNIKHVMTSGVNAPVSSTMKGETDGRELSSVAPHVLFIGDPSISVNKTAALIIKDEEGKVVSETNLPNNATVQAGTVVDYTITLTNTGGLPLHNLAVVDEHLGINFSVDEDGNVTAQYNPEGENNTKVTDLVFTVLGTGVSDGIYTISGVKDDGTPKTTEELEEELKNLISKLTQIVYPTGATLEVSGIKHPTTETCTSTAVGTADSLQNYEGAEEKGWEQFGQDYMNYLTNGGTEPDYTKYIDVTGKEEVCENYVTEYKKYIQQVKENGLVNADVLNPVDFGFTADEPVTDDATLVLNAQQSNYVYYSQAGQTIDIQLQEETVVSLPQHGTWGDDSNTKTVEIGKFQLTEGAHNVTIYNNGAGDGGYNIHNITLIDSNGKKYVLTAKTEEGADEDAFIPHGDVTVYPDSGVVAVNNKSAAITYPVDLDMDDTYTVNITYVSASSDHEAVLVFDYLPGNYVITDETGYVGDWKITDGDVDTIATYTNGNATVVVDNTNAYPELTYTYKNDETASQIFGVLAEGSAAGVIPDTVRVNTYDVSNDVYVLDYGLKVNLSNASENNGLFQNDVLSLSGVAKSNQEVTFSGVKVFETLPNPYVYEYAKTGYGKNATGTYGAVSTTGEGAGTDVTYKLNGFLEGIEYYGYGVQVGMEGAAVKDSTTSTPVMEAKVTIMPATIVYYEDNFASVITNGTVTEGPGDEYAKYYELVNWDPFAATFDSATGVWTLNIPELAANSNAGDWEVGLRLSGYKDLNGNSATANIFDEMKEGVTYKFSFQATSTIDRVIAVGGDGKRLNIYKTVELKAGETQTVEIEFKKTDNSTGCGPLMIYAHNVYVQNQAGENGGTDESARVHVDGYAAHTITIQNLTFAETGFAEREQGNGLDTQYGYDDAYKNDGEYSNKGYTALASTEKLAFTFQGTGFDILTRTAQANLKISVYDAEKFEIKTYTYGEGKTGISVVRKTGVATTEKALKNFTINASYENGTLDQIPLISVDMEAYGKYIVLAQKAGTEEDLHVDGIRIYNPIPVDDEVSDAYDNAKGEEGAIIREIRNMIFGEGYIFDFQNPSDPSTVVLEAGKGAVAGLVQMVGNQLNITTGNTIVESYTGAVNSADIAKNPASTSSLLGYAVSGPNNELYLSGEEYAFGAVINDITADSMLQIGLKAISDSATVQYKALDGSWKDIADASNLTASIEMYYKLDVADLWKCNEKTVLLVRVSSGTASLTNLKYNGVTFEKITANALGATVVEDANTSSFNILSSSFAGSNAIITFSVKNTVTDFTIADAEGNVVFTYGTKEALPEGVVVRKKAGEDLDIYVVKMPKTAGTYTIYTSAGTEFGTAQFTVE